MTSKIIPIISILVASLFTSIAEEKKDTFNPLSWKRPVENSVFTSSFGNNHDSILFIEPDHEYPYWMIVSHTQKYAQLWKSKTFSWTSEHWQLVDSQYKIGNFYEYDDGVKVGDTYYIYESGKVFTYTGKLKDSNGKWKITGTFPAKTCDDIGVYYEHGVYHIFGEYGKFPHGADGTSLSHYTSHTGTGNWKLIDKKAVNPNPDGGSNYGVGDPTIAKIGDYYYLYCDQETKHSPYKIMAWRSKDINQPFELLGKAITPRSTDTQHWDNYRIQDGDLAFIPELNGYVMSCNMMDKDGNPGGHFPTLKNNETRVIGIFYQELTKIPQRSKSSKPKK